jgi:hypothetical protein
VKIEFLDPQLISPSNFSAEMLFMRKGAEEQTKYNVTLVPKYPIRMMDEGCQFSHCSLAEFKLEVPKLDTDDIQQGGIGSISLVSKSKVYIRPFAYTFMPGGDPEIVSLNPKFVPLNGGTIAMYVKNFPSPDCHVNSSCSKEAAGLSLNFVDDSIGPIRPPSLADSNGMLVITFVAIASEKAGDYGGYIWLAGAESLAFNVSYTMPPAGILPVVDGKIQGGESAVITLRGWLKRTESFVGKDKSTFNVWFGQTKRNSEDKETPPWGTCHMRRQYEPLK